MEHKHNVHDSDAHFMIDPIARTIKSTSDQKLTIMQNDHNSERFTFCMPRFVERHDMMMCDRAEIYFINIGAEKSNKSEGIYEIDDIAVSAENADNINFSWLISRAATVHAGTLNFLVRFACLADDGTEVYAWHTGVSTDFKVSGGILIDAAEIIEPYVDVLAQWKADLFGVGDTQEQRLLSASAEQQNAIDAKGAAVLASIPAEYADLSALADDNFRRKAGAIMQTAAGESITVSDASDYPVSALTVYGRSTQGGTPTPENPVDIKNIENMSVHFHTSNILPYPYKDTTKTENGITYTDNGDGTITANGTATGMSMFVLYYDEEKPVNVDSYYLSGCPSGGSLETYILRTSNITTSSATDYGDGVKSTVSAKYVFIRIFEGAVVENLTFKPMMNIGNEFMLFEKGVKNGCMIPRTLRGIPVASGGNYTDENGQQWISDEVDFERGVFVRRIGVKTFDGSEIWQNYKNESRGIKYGFRIKINDFASNFNAYSTDRSGLISNRFEYGDYVCENKETGIGISEAQYIYMRFDGADDNITDFDALNAWLAEKNAEGEPITVYYPLQDVEEAPLSDAEITAFRALHTNKPNTTIFNDSGAYMAAEYVADTKTYIDNKISEMIGGENT